MNIIKKLIFYPILYLRGIFMLAGKLISFLLLLSAVIVYFAQGILPAVICILLSFAVFLIRLFYDKILLKLNPTDMNLTLYQ